MNNPRTRPIRTLHPPSFQIVPMSKNTVEAVAAARRSPQPGKAGRLSLKLAVARRVQRRAGKTARRKAGRHLGASPHVPTVERIRLWCPYGGRYAGAGSTIGLRAAARPRAAAPRQSRPDRQALQKRLTRRLAREEELLDDEPASPPIMAFEPGELRMLLDDQPAFSTRDITMGHRRPKTNPSMATCNPRLPSRRSNPRRLMRCLEKHRNDDRSVASGRQKLIARASWRPTTRTL